MCLYSQFGPVQNSWKSFHLNIFLATDLCSVNYWIYQCLTFFHLQIVFLKNHFPKKISQAAFQPSTVQCFQKRSRRDGAGTSERERYEREVVRSPWKLPGLQDGRLYLSCFSTANKFLGVLMDSTVEGVRSEERRESELDFQLRRCFIMLWLLDNHWHRSGTDWGGGGGMVGV
jgi:hypothetical protein